MKKNIFFAISLLLLISSVQAQLTVQWKNFFNAPPGSEDQAKAIVTDNSGNIYVAGDSYYSGAIRNGCLIKYNSSGVQQWLSVYNDNNETNIYDMALDNSGNIIVFGSGGAGAGVKLLTVKYNSSGVQQWAKVFTNPPNDVWPTAMTIDTTGNVYVSGSSFLVKYNSSGVQQWVASLTSSSFARELAADNAGNVYVAGYYNSGNGYDFVVIKYNPSGSQEWLRGYNGGAGNTNDNANSISLDNQGNVYATGFTTTAPGKVDYITVKYNSSGVQQWLQVYNGPSNGGDSATSLILDGSGNVYVTGRSEGGATTIKYNSSGVQQWVQNAPVYSSIPFLKLDFSSNIYLGNRYEFLKSNNSCELLKYNSTGVQQWYYKVSTQDSTYVNDFAIDNQGFVIVSGRKPAFGQNSSYDFSTIKYSQPIGIKKISNEVPDKFVLYQNYPNPFNPVTVISYSVGIPSGQLVVSSFTTLKIYDVLGHEVATLVNEELKPGTYEVGWDGSNFSSGIYYYQLRIIINPDGTTSSGLNNQSPIDYSETKKMILIK